MAWFAIPWSLSLLPLPALMLGLVNDDTIHMLWHHNAKGNRRSALEFGWRRNALEAAPALMATTVVLATALSTLYFSDIRSNQDLGLLIPLGLVLALLCNLSLLPALSSLGRR